MASTSEILWVVAFVLIVISVTRMLFSKQHKLNLPPGPPPFPIIGSLHLIGTHPHKSLADLAQQYGPVMSIRIGQRNFIVATSPDSAKEFLKLQDSNFSARAPMRASELLLPKDLVFSNITPVFRHLRKLLVSEVTSPKRLQASKHVRAEELAYLLRSISKETGPIRLKTYLHVLASNALSHMILGKRFLGYADQSGESATTAADNENEVMEFVHIIEEMEVCFGFKHPQDFFDIVPKWFDVLGIDARIRKLRDRMDLFYANLINQHTENRKKNPISEDEKMLLDVLLEQLDSKEYDITETHVRSFIWDVFAAGTNTTMFTSEWTMAEVLSHPAVFQRARSELDRVVGVNRTVQESDIPELKYIGAIIKEALRLHPPGPMLVPHMSINATKAFGYDIPAKTRVFVNAWGIGRSPGIWEKPLEFAPERFLLGGVDGSRDFRGQHYELLPFGSGRRGCPGMAFAATSMHATLASLLHAFDWELPDAVAPEKLVMTEGTAFTLSLRDSLVVIAKPRLPSHLY